MTLDDDHKALAAEYVLGTLDAAERTRAEELAQSDAEFAALVGEWERRLGELHAMVDAIEPPAELFARIKARLPAAEEPAAPSAQARAPDIEVVPEERPVDGELPPPQRVDLRAPSQVAALANRVRRWRAATTGFGALAAALAAVIVGAALRPDALPARFRPKPQLVEVVKTVTVEKPAPAPSRFVAVLQQGGASPAFILTVDVASKTITARRVAADPQAGKSYELWLVSDQFPTPRSLGVVGADEFTTGAKLANYEPDTISGATYAVSLEPEGGSPTGAPTGPVLWTGKLVEATPP